MGVTTRPQPRRWALFRLGILLGRVDGLLLKALPDDLVHGWYCGVERALREQPRRRT